MTQQSTQCLTRTLFGADGLAPWLAAGSGRRVSLLVDPGVLESEIVSRVRRQVVKAGREAELTVLPGPGTLAGVLDLAGRLRGIELVVGVGGGSLLDQAKLLTLLYERPAARARLSVPQRSGMTVLPQGTERAVRLVAVPTTLGTGAELSTVACLEYPQGKRLVSGECLRPDIAVLDPVATDTLPAELISEGVLEALFRLVSLYAGDHADLPTEDALAEAVAVRLVTAGHQVRRARSSGRPVDRALRLEIAKLSGLTHQEWIHLGRTAFANKGWLIANEVSGVLGVRKMRAVAALLPPLWRAIAGGERRLGSARRLARLWPVLRAVDPAGLPGDPADGMATLIDSWLVERRLSAGEDALDAIAARIVRAWGAGLPMLGGLAKDEVRRLLAEVIRTPDAVAALPTKGSRGQAAG
ncbi:daptide-type RiPP biosynthesis dehydogenase [Nonomuraea sp. NPDC050202]|uniref:daptide-type RiPP biosynthesis dehydogenase n=1 Tax=Nonomuraea sp. NPDC050202 TaxID=3155035 RepID=UPI0033DA70CD